MIKKLFGIFTRAKNIKTYIVSLLASFVGIFLNFALAKILQAEAYGEIQYLVALGTTISTFLILGISSFLIREAKNDEHQGEILNKCLTLFFIILIFAGPIVFYILNNFTSKTQNNAFLSFLILIMASLMGINNIFISNFQGNGKYHLSIIFENFLPKTVMLILLFIFFGIGQLPVFQNYYLLFYILIYGSVGAFFAIKLFKRINFSFTKKDILSVLFFSGVSVTYSLSSNVTKVLQGGLFNNATALAIISVSTSILSLVNVFTGVIDSIAKPIFAKHKRENNIDEIFDVFKLVTRLSSYISIPFYVFFITAPTHFLSLFGSTYLTYPNILIILAVASVINSITGPSGTLLAMTGQEKIELANGLIYLGSYVIFAFAFSFDKIYGLCLSLMFSQLIVNVVKYIEIGILYKKMPLDIKSVLTILIIIIFDFTLIFFTRYISNLTLWLIVGVTVGGLTIIMNFIISPFRKKDLKEFVNLSV